MKNYQSEVDKLNHIISEADSERFQQQREYDVVINERDILGTQVRADRSRHPLLGRHSVILTPPKLPTGPHRCRYRPT